MLSTGSTLSGAPAPPVPPPAGASAGAAGGPPTDKAGAPPREEDEDDMAEVITLSPVVKTPIVRSRQSRSSSIYIGTNSANGSSGNLPALPTNGSNVGTGASTPARSSVGAVAPPEAGRNSMASLNGAVAGFIVPPGGGNNANGAGSKRGSGVSSPTSHADSGYGNGNLGNHGVVPHRKGTGAGAAVQQAAEKPYFGQAVSSSDLLARDLENVFNSFDRL